MTLSRPRRRTLRVSEAQPPATPPAAARLLLDTHVWLWWQAGDARLGRRARDAIVAAGEVRLSAASAWELAIKMSLGKLEISGGVDIAAELERDGFQPLAVELEHALAVRRLPAVHRDPFDRMLAAQALVDGLTVVTADPVFRKYGVEVLEATPARR